MAKRPTRVQQELEQIRKANRGILRAEDTIEFARDPTTALHGRFCWDDTEAAHQFRLEQARRLIRVHVTVIENTDKKVRAYVSLKRDRTKRGGGYRTQVSVQSKRELREEQLTEALEELNRCRAKYEDLAELAPVFEALDQVERKVGAKKKRAATRRRAAA